jgi:hypothetical protein
VVESAPDGGLQPIKLQVLHLGGREVILRAGGMEAQRGLFSDLNHSFSPAVRPAAKELVLRRAQLSGIVMSNGSSYRLSGGGGNSAAAEPGTPSQQEQRIKMPPSSDKRGKDASPAALALGQKEEGDEGV